MDNTTLCIHEYLNTVTRRCINQVILLFSLSNHLDITLIGRKISAGNNIIIINHSDLYQISNAQQVVEICIPIRHFIKLEKHFFNSNYNFKLLNSEPYLKYQILTMAQQLNQSFTIDTSLMTEIITKLNKEARVEYDTPYIPTIDTENSLLNKITEFIKANISLPLLSKDVSKSFYISASYISILFKKHLGMSFKNYITSLKIALSLSELVQNKQTIYQVSEQFGFNHYSNYTQQFKHFMQMTPNEFRKNVQSNPKMIVQLVNEDISQYQSAIDTYTSDKPQTINQINIELNQLTFNDAIKSPTVFIHVDNLMDIVQSDYNTKLSFKDLTNAYILINNSRNLALENLSLTGMIDFIDALFSNYVGIAIRIKSLNQFDLIEDSIFQFLKYKPKYVKQNRDYNFLLLLDATHLSLTDINRLYIKTKNFNVKLNIKVGITVEGVIEQTHSLKNASKLLNRFNFDFHFIDIEQDNVQTLLNKKSTHFNNSMSHFEYYNKLIEETQIDASKFVYTKLSKKGFLLYDGKHPLQITDLMCHMLIMLKRGSGVGYELIRKEKYDIALMNNHSIYEPLMYLYQFVKPFISKYTAIHQNYIILHEDHSIHLLLFNAPYQRSSTQDVQKFILKEKHLPAKTTLFIQTLNREHGFVDYALPSSFNDTYIERSLLRYIEDSTIPKAEIRHFSRSDSPLYFTLHHDELKYIRILPS